MGPQTILAAYVATGKLLQSYVHCGLRPDRALSWSSLFGPQKLWQIRHSVTTLEFWVINLSKSCKEVGKHLMSVSCGIEERPMLSLPVISGRQYRCMGYH